MKNFLKCLVFSFILVSLFGLFLSGEVHARYIREAYYTPYVRYVPPPPRYVPPRYVPPRNPPPPPPAPIITNCSSFSCPRGYSGKWDGSVNRCICQRDSLPVTISNLSVIKYTCSNGSGCPAGTYCGVTNSGGTICVKYGSGSSSTGSTSPKTSSFGCMEDNTDCDPKPYCEASGLSSTDTGGNPLVNIAQCTARIDCFDIPRKATCYEPTDGSDSDIRKLKVTVGEERVSDWKEQRRKPEGIRSFLEKFIPSVFAQTEPYVTETELGFANDGASGLELNNPVLVESRYSDTDGVNDLEALYFWLAKEGTTPTNTPQYVDETGDGSNAQSESNENYGFMVRRTGDDWSNADVYVPEIVVAGDYWVKVGTWGEDFFIDGPDGLPMVRIVNSEMTVPSSDDVVIAFGLEFLHQTSGVEDFETVYEGTYDVYSMSHDEFSFIPWDNYEFDEHINLGDLRTNYFSENEIRDYEEWEDMDLDWIVDLTPPEIAAVTVQVTGDTQLGVSWNVSDDESGVGYVVGNVYRNSTGSNVVEDALSYVGPDTPKIYEIPEFNEDTLGSLMESNLWLIDVLGVTTPSQSRTETVDIQDNTGGLMDFYVTVFDKAGNIESLSDSFNLSSWMITKGGLVYSTSGTNVGIRLLDFAAGEEWATDLWYSPHKDTFPTATIFDSSLTDFSTETLSGNVDYPEDLYELGHSQPIEEGGVYNVSTKVLQNTGMLRNSMYQTYKSKTESQLSAISAETIDIGSDTTFAGNASDYCASEYCVVNTEYNLTLSSDFLCDTRILFMTSADITIEPNITNDSSTDGCIFVSGGDITIEEGNYASEGSTEPLYDVVEGYFLTDGAIMIESGDAGLNVKDGLQINGGLIAFGGTQSIAVGRDMKLIDKAKYPTLAIHTDARYGKMALEFFGPERSVYKQEVGFKPF